MANRTDPAAKSIHGTNPQNLVEKILRSKIYQNTYWKEQCFGLTAETLVDKAMELDHLGGTYGGNRKPTPFMCLVMKMLQIQPEKDIVVEFIKNEDYKCGVSSPFPFPSRLFSFEKFRKIRFLIDSLQVCSSSRGFLHAPYRVGHGCVSVSGAALQRLPQASQEAARRK